MKNIFVDAQKMQEKYPKTFQAPTYNDLDQLKVAGFVKVNADGKRFWVEITQIKDQKITGTIAKYLVRNEHGLNFGDIIKFEKRHVFQTQV